MLYMAYHPYCPLDVYCYNCFHASYFACCASDNYAESTVAQAILTFYLVISGHTHLEYQ